MRPKHTQKYHRWSPMTATVFNLSNFTDILKSIDLKSILTEPPSYINIYIDHVSKVNAPIDTL